jgi:hypothetical protein
MAMHLLEHLLMMCMYGAFLLLIHRCVKKARAQKRFHANTLCCSVAIWPHSCADKGGSAGAELCQRKEEDHLCREKVPCKQK